MHFPRNIPILGAKYTNILQDNVRAGGKQWTAAHAAHVWIPLTRAPYPSHRIPAGGRSYPGQRQRNARIRSQPTTLFEAYLFLYLFIFLFFVLTCHVKLISHITRTQESCLFLLIPSSIDPLHFLFIYMHGAPKKKDPRPVGLGPALRDGRPLLGYGASICPC